MYLHVIEYIQPFTIDKREAPRKDKPISTSKFIHKAPLHPLEKVQKSQGRYEIQTKVMMSK